MLVDEVRVDWSAVVIRVTTVCWETIRCQPCCSSSCPRISRSCPHISRLDSTFDITHPIRSQGMAAAPVTHLVCELRSRVERLTLFNAFKVGSRL